MIDGYLFWFKLIWLTLSDDEKKVVLTAVEIIEKRFKFFMKYLDKKE